MSNDPIELQAAQKIAEMARRVMAQSRGRTPTAAFGRQRARAALQIAAEISSDPKYAAEAAAVLQADETAKPIASDDREWAAGIIIMMVQSRTGERESEQRERLRGYDIALGLHAQTSWAFSRASLLEKLGDFAAAAQAFEAIPRNANESAQARHRAKECLAKAKDAATAPAAPRPSGEETPLDVAAKTAQRFAEYLAAGDFDSAQHLLGGPLRSMTAEALRAAYVEMIDGDEPDVGGEVEISVMSSSNDMPALTKLDLGWVYVSMRNDAFNEAIAVVVTRENGISCIRDLEWGRP